MTRHEARRLALQVLYQVDLVATRPDVALERAARMMGCEGEEGLDYAGEVVRGVTEHQAELDRWIQKYAVDWTVDRMAVVDRNLLRIALYELLFRPDIPPAAAASEAVELAKEFGDTDSRRFVNGIIGSFLREQADLLNR
ncbi:MAG TPA: transcription antitermination factor NusB [Firmicutes bacterium]|nr:transcription antitermination factor NusB [Bacillota bacterium]